MEIVLDFVLDFLFELMYVHLVLSNGDQYE
jgi:hypothetical protein